MRRSSRRRRWPWALVAVLVALALAGGAWWLRPGEAPAATSAEATEPVTAPVERATLTERLRLNAQLTYGDAVPLPPAGGVVTALPAAGSVIATGERVYEVDGRPVVLLPGERPFWRELAEGAEAGEDVRQLQQALAVLGLFDAEADGRFGPRTARALKEWQKRLGLPQTGVFSPADAVVADAPGIRIARVTARLGESGTSPTSYTETTLRASARLTEAQARELAVGTPVTVVLPDGTEVGAALTAIDPGGQPTGDGEAKTNPSATVEFPDQAAVAAVGAVPVRIVVAQSEEQPATLVVPVTALLATADGGYAVETYAEGGMVRTPVVIGLIADARVQVLASGTEIEGGTGPALAEGDRVVLAR